MFCRRRLAICVAPHQQIARSSARIEGTLPPRSLFAATLQTIQESLGAWGGWPRLLAEDVLVSDLVALHPIYEYASPRLAHAATCLIGDAAHLASPITGSGVRMAMTDALALADLFHEHRGNGRTLATQFEQQRLAEAQRIVDTGRWHGQAFRRTQ